jgi:hypothetical protein
LPYIKKIYRPKLFECIKQPLKYNNQTERIIQLASILDSLPKEKFKGALHYVCAQLIRHQKSYSESIIMGLLSIYYLNKEVLSYDTLECAGGLLHRMRVEFNRRNWSSFNGYDIIDNLQRWIDIYYANPLETIKEKENGDLE